MEKERNQRIPFLDLLIEKTEKEINISIYRKPTYTGLGINYLSACFDKYKTNAITTLLHRAFNLSSNFELFQREVEFLRSFFKSNGFSENIFFKYLKKFLDNKYKPKKEKIGPEKQLLYIRFPYISKNINELLSNELGKLFWNPYNVRTRMIYIYIYIYI